MRILVVDDDPGAVELLRAILAPLGEVFGVGDGQKALELFRHGLDDGTPFDLVCLDIRMPGTDGQRVLSAMRRMERARGLSRERWSRILMTTGVTDRPHVLKALEEACDGYVVKPVTRDDLFDRLEGLGMIEGGRPVRSPAPDASAPGTPPS
jgi:two-component system chemotaxis response regulator CheY